VESLPTVGEDYGLNRHHLRWEGNKSPFKQRKVPEEKMSCSEDSRLESEGRLIQRGECPISAKKMKAWGGLIIKHKEKRLKNGQGNYGLRRLTGGGGGNYNREKLEISKSAAADRDESQDKKTHSVQSEGNPHPVGQRGKKGPQRIRKKLTRGLGRSSFVERGFGAALLGRKRAGSRWGGLDGTFYSAGQWRTRITGRDLTSLLIMRAVPGVLIEAGLLGDR